MLKGGRDRVEKVVKRKDGRDFGGEKDGEKNEILSLLIAVSHPQPHRKLLCGLGHFLFWREDKGMCVWVCDEAVGQQDLLLAGP